MKKVNEKKLREDFERAKKALSDAMSSNFVDKALQVFDERENRKEPKLSEKDKRIVDIMKRDNFSYGYVEVLGLIAGVDYKSLISNQRDASIYEVIIPLCNGTGMVANNSCVSLGYLGYCLTASGGISSVGANNNGCAYWKYATRDDIKSFCTNATPKFFERIGIVGSLSECERKNIINSWLKCG